VPEQSVGIFVVIEGESGAAIRSAVAESDRPPVQSWNGGPGVLCTGVVETAADARRAVLAALAGSDLVVDCRADREIADAMCDDLRRLGRLDHRVMAAPDAVLGNDQRLLLSALAAGRSLSWAAQQLHVSKRTADRRLAAARTSLGAANTAEAIVTATRRGLLDVPHAD
jgi:DNA-binding NarL/FixJ family response regulator